jgi:putative tributyrin esterase|uniref:alpha/beta hydrolase n=1 Tax=Lachnospira sp. TaxID=2049031 RepID=UPI003FEE463A
MAVMNINVFSVMLRHGMDVTVVLPDDIDEGEQLKCVWLYHGGSGDNTEWLYHTPLVDTVEKRHFAAVLPNVDDSCFVNMNIGNKYENYVAKELPSIIWNMFKCISDKREDNYVSGYSNGGYGCLHTVLKYPKKFSKVGAFSAGDKADSAYVNDGSAKAKGRINLFGDGDIHNTDYCLTYLADKLIAADTDIIPDVYHACGGRDPWLDMNHIVRDYFLEHKDVYKNYTYDEIDELGHEWRFWDIELNKFLDYAGLKEVRPAKV